MRPPITAADVERLVDSAARTRQDDQRQRILADVAVAAERLDFAGLSEAMAAVERAVGLLDPSGWENREPAARAKVRNRLRALLPWGAAQAFDLTHIRPIDSWSDVVIPALSERFGDRAAVGALVEHVATMPGPRPSKAWRDRCAERLAAAEDAGAEAVRLLLRAMLELEPGSHVDHRTIPPPTYRGRGWPVLLSAANAEVVRGAAWAAALAGGPDVPDLLHAVYRAASRPRLDGGVHGARAAHGCLAALGHLATPEAVDALVDLRDTERNGHAQAQIERALAGAAARTGMSRSEFEELHVSDGGLAAGGRLVVELGAWLGVLELNDRGDAELSWIDGDGRAVKRVPPLLAREHPGGVAELREARRVLAGAAVDGRSRLEHLPAEDRVWDIETWAARYVDHPFTGSLTRSLLWRVELPDGEGWTGLPDHIRVPHAMYAVGAVVRPWHPLHVSDDELLQWRQYLFERKMRQPVEQVFRPVYRLTDAERGGDSLETLRFAGRQLDTRLARQAMRRLGWRVVRGSAAAHRLEARRDPVVDGLRAVFMLLEGGRRRAGTWRTAEVRFVARRGRVVERVPLGEVPAIVVSDVLCDVDRIVDGAREDRDPAAEEPLTERGVLRGEVLDRFVVPALPIANRCHVRGPFLVVDGRAQRHRIHLGTGAVLDERGDAVAVDRAAATRRARRVFVPFEATGRLADIVGRAIVLASPSFRLEANR
ncbi:MAG: DUF4132 domain-containing protein [Acidimicrobiales bacterium]